MIFVLLVKPKYSVFSNTLLVNAFDCMWVMSHSIKNKLITGTVAGYQFSSNRGFRTLSKYKYMELISPYFIQKAMRKSFNLWISLFQFQIWITWSAKISLNWRWSSKHLIVIDWSEFNSKLQLQRVIFVCEKRLSVMPKPYWISITIRYVRDFSGLHIWNKFVYNDGHRELHRSVHQRSLNFVRYSDTNDEYLNMDKLFDVQIQYFLYKVQKPCKIIFWTEYSEYIQKKLYFYFGTEKSVFPEYPIFAQVIPNLYKIF